jgi:hypothetical protein
METSFPRGKVEKDSGSGDKSSSRGRSVGAGAERLFGKRPTSEGRERKDKRDGSEGGSKKPRRDKSSGGGSRDKSKVPRDKSATGKKAAPDFEPVSADRHVIKRADELSFKVNSQPLLSCVLANVCLRFQLLCLLCFCSCSASALAL